MRIPDAAVEFLPNLNAACGLTTEQRHRWVPAALPNHAPALASTLSPNPRMLYILWE
jgi:hypothetical protein